MRAGPGGAARQLSDEDLSILALENETVAGHTCKVIMLRGALELDQLRSAIAARLPRAPGLCLRLGEIGGEPWWLPDTEVDVKAHVVQAQPIGTRDEAEFRGLVASIFARHLERSRPLWQIDLIPVAGGAALAWRIHHALADGSTAIRMADAVLWDADLAAGPGVATPGHRPGVTTQGHRPHAAQPGGQGTARHRLGGLRIAAREAPQPWLRSPFDGHIDAERAVAFASAGLEELRRAAATVDRATVNDAVLAVVAGGLRSWLQSHHGHLGEIRVKVPVSLHGAVAAAGSTDSAGSEPGNRDSFFCLDLPLGSADPVERLAAIRRATRTRKQGHDAQHLDAVMHQLARVPRLRQFAGRVLAHPRSFALTVSNVHGPRQPVSVLGAPVTSLHSLAEIGEQHALRISVLSLADTLNFGLVADPTLLADVDALAAAIGAEAELLTARLASS